MACNNLVLALTNFWIYCDLFHHTISEGYNSSPVRHLSATARQAWFRFCVPDDTRNPGFDGQREQLDLIQILNGLQTEALDIIMSKTTTTRMEPDTWITRCVFHTGLPALRLLKTRSPASTDIEIVNITKRKIREGDYPYGASSDEPDAWHSMNNDIRWGWYYLWQSEEA
ncbi:hypothetical protein FRB94_014203 [Tulasnella sp. JGI-2019a]|nr:hypothetical protein FRB94_014203 [Tulasnella sp. JGI-2019a]